MIKQLEVQIMGQSYLLGCPENGDARMLDAVNRVDIAMCKIRDAGKIKARDRIAVLAALNMAFEFPEQAMQSTPPSLPLQTALPSTHEPSPHLTALLQRLDTALGNDGQLL